jgi:hypothetical protein
MLHSSIKTEYLKFNNVEKVMAIQELNKAEIEVVSGGAALNLTALVSGLPLVGGLLGGVLGLVGGLLNSVSGLLTGLPVVGPVLGNVLGAVFGVVGGVVTL